MKNTRRILLLAAFGLVSQTSFAQVQSPDTMVHSIFATLKAKDEAAFVKLYPNSAQFSRFMRTLMEQAFKSEQMQQIMALDEKAKNLNVDSLINAQAAAFSDPKEIEKLAAAFGGEFQKIIKKGESKGVKWSEAKLTSYTIDTASRATDDPLKPKEMRGIIDFTVGDSAYQLAYEKVMYIPGEGGWFGAEFSQLARKGESLAPDVEKVLADPTNFGDDTATVAVPVPKENAPKGETSGVKKSSSGKKGQARKPKTKS